MFEKYFYAGFWFFSFLQLENVKSGGKMSIGNYLFIVGGKKGK
jgi:hypothetical protein